jgi:hypothetical protein
MGRRVSVADHPASTSFLSGGERRQSSLRALMVDGAAPNALSELDAAGNARPSRRSSSHAPEPTVLQREDEFQPLKSVAICSPRLDARFMEVGRPAESALITHTD